MSLSTLFVVFTAVSATEAPTCIPGAQSACACPGGALGVQVCEASGDRLGPCECGAPASQPIVLEPPPTRVQPARIRYEGGPIPNGYELKERTRWGVVVPGLAVTAGLYLLSGLVASVIDSGSPSSKAHQWLYLPVAGPFINAATNPRHRADKWTFLLVMNGLIQTGGVVAAIWGAMTPQQELVRLPFAVSPIVTDGEPVPRWRHTFRARLEETHLDRVAQGDAVAVLQQHRHRERDPVDLNALAALAVADLHAADRLVELRVLQRDPGVVDLHVALLASSDRHRLLI